MDAITDQTFEQFKKQIASIQCRLLYFEQQMIVMISHYEEKEPEAASLHKKRMEAAGEELRKITQNNTEAILVLEEQQALNAACKDKHQHIMKHLRRSYDRKVKELGIKLTESHLFNKRMQNAGAASSSCGGERQRRWESSKAIELKAISTLQQRVGDWEIKRTQIGMLTSRPYEHRAAYLSGDAATDARVCAGEPKKAQHPSSPTTSSFPHCVVEKGSDELRNLWVDGDDEWGKGALKVPESLKIVAVVESSTSSSIAQLARSVRGRAAGCQPSSFQPVASVTSSHSTRRSSSRSRSAPEGPHTCKRPRARRPARRDCDRGTHDREHVRRAAAESMHASTVGHRALETLLLRSVEWTAFFEHTHAMVLEQATVILRNLLGAGHVQVSQTMLPAELTVIDEPEEIATEYLHNASNHGRSMQGPAPTRHARASSIEEYRGLIDREHDQMMKLLTNLNRALELPNVVVDSRYKVYEDFMHEAGRTLTEYLGAVRQAISALLGAWGFRSV
ncbi:hypothetical protein HYPSUDRAFT_209616 [Hypholoma sublateritium FD-334 SS-4]|uniref:Uncharacterized protein n=1 Tax=Hypholoma sublateritium (strain FD-334 SS-4) TaxID=945553 RepID=A0A0D2KFW7_HYPSF|nr:hypothetical protein HYPSUDRAFT_209616 [Hypholoma sublateritium FD-334 SS-4]